MHRQSRKRAGSSDVTTENLFADWCRMKGGRVYQCGQKRNPIGFGRYPPNEIFGCFDGETLDLVIKNYPMRAPDAVRWARSTSNVAHWYWQATTGSGPKDARRRKIHENGPWPAGADVLLLTHETTENPVDRRKPLHFWALEAYVGKREFMKLEAIQFDPDEVRAWRGVQRESKKKARAQKATAKEARA